MTRLKRLLLPGVIFQSVVVAGGYGTGRELVEFFYSLGLVGGLLALFITGMIWSVMCGLTFAFAKRFQAYDYRTFFTHLLGRGWFLFELSYIGVVLIVLSIVVASCGSLLQEQFGLPYYAGVFALAVYILFMLYKGSRSIERMLSFWTVMLYFVFFTIFCCLLWIQGGNLIPLFSSKVPSILEIGYQGVRYAGYNLGLIPAVLFTMRHLKSEKEGFQAGALAGVLAILPAMMIFTSLHTSPESLQKVVVPLVSLLGQIGSRFLACFYYLVMVMTLVETGIGLLHAFSERVVVYFGEEDKEVSRLFGLYLSASFIACSILMAHYGLVDLIANGYGVLTWVIIGVYLVPLTTVGVYKLVQKPKYQWAHGRDSL